MGIPIHPRLPIVRAASLELEQALWGVMSKHDLTYIEALTIVNETTKSVLRSALRQERHPDDPDKRSDEV